MTPGDARALLLNEVRSLIDRLPAARAFTGQTLDLVVSSDIQPRDLPVTSHLTGMLTKTCPATEALTFAVLAATPHMTWQQSYSVAQVGANYLENYGWFNLIAPDGPILSDTFRVSFGFWNQGLSYPRHWHEPEELYIVLAGSARFLTDGRDAFDANPGDTVYHPSSLGHAIEMTGPMLAMALWKGQGLNNVSTLEGEA